MKKQRLSRNTGCALKRAAGKVGDPRIEGWRRKSDRCHFSYDRKKPLILHTSREKLMYVFQVLMDTF
jgi:hypothetical protein